jgi:hypothetical protein
VFASVSDIVRLVPAFLCVLQRVSASVCSENKPVKMQPEANVESFTSLLYTAFHARKVCGNYRKHSECFVCVYYPNNLGLARTLLLTNVVLVNYCPFVIRVPFSGEGNPVFCRVRFICGHSQSIFICGHMLKTSFGEFNLRAYPKHFHLRSHA